MYLCHGGILGVVSHARAKPHCKQLDLHVGKALLYPTKGAIVRARAPDATRIIPSLRTHQRIPISVISSSLAAAVNPRMIHAGTVTAHVNQLGTADGPRVNSVSKTMAAPTIPNADDLCLFEIIW